MARKLLDALLTRATESDFARLLLNLILPLLIPFMRGHCIRVVGISSTSVSARLPFRRRNHNHIRGLHACALATVAELCSGLLLIRELGFVNYRIIMKSISVTYHRQGKTNAVARCVVANDFFSTEIVEPLKNTESVQLTMPVHIYDEHEEQLCQADIEWHIKPWENVRTET